MALSGAEIDGIRIGLALTTFGFGLRHGVDWDHIAAITDVSGTQEDPRRGMVLATLYATGHGVVVFALGLAAIYGGHVLPPWIDAAMERVVGLTLVVLAGYVVVSMLRNGRNFRMRSRLSLLGGIVSGAVVRSRARVVEIVHDHIHDDRHGHSHALEAWDQAQPEARLAPVALKARHRHPHRHVAQVPADPFTSGKRSAVALGVVHGIGAETPTQVVLFLTAAHVAGTAGAVALLGLFIVGLLVSNTAIACSASFGYLNATRNFRVYAGVAVVNAAFSLVVGVVFLTGHGGVLPPVLGG